MEKAMIEITEIAKKQVASKMQPGELYWDVSVTDGKTGRKAKTFGDWAKDWKLGDQVEVIWEQNSWKNREGVEIQGWKLKDPNAKPRSSGGGYSPRPAAEGSPLIVHAYLIAAKVAPLLFKAEKKLHLNDIAALAEAIFEKLKAHSPAPAAVTAETPKAEEKKAEPAKAVPKAEPKTTAPAVEEDGFEEDDDKPF